MKTFLLGCMLVLSTTFAQADEWCRAKLELIACADVEILNVISDAAVQGREDLVSWYIDGQTCIFIPRDASVYSVSKESETCRYRFNNTYLKCHAIKITPQADKTYYSIGGDLFYDCEGGI